MRHNQHHQYLPMFFVLFIISNLLLVACDNSPKTYTIGVVNILPVLDVTIQGFKAGMTDFGYIEGENITYLHEETVEMDTLHSALQDMVTADVDLILATTTLAAQAAQQATADTDTPVVFSPLTDPVGAGLVKSLKQPGENITGITFGIQEARRLEWLVRIDPAIKQIYVPYNPDDQAPAAALKTVSAAAAKLGVQLIIEEIRNFEELSTAFKNIPVKADAIFVLPDSLIGTRARELVKVAIELQLPLSGPSIEAGQNGTLTAYGAEPHVSGKQAARLADQIFQGVKPSDLPVEMAEFYLGSNLQTAEAIGLDIPDEILLQADIIIR